MKAFVVNSSDLLDSKKNPHLVLSPDQILKNKKITKKFLACLWCGNDIPAETPYAKYCSDRCQKESKGQTL